MRNYGNATHFPTEISGAGRAKVRGHPTSLGPVSGSEQIEREDPQQAGPKLDRLPEDWDRALAVVAHPDDLEYGARRPWPAGPPQEGRPLRAGHQGEAGIDSMPPEQTGPLRTAEQVAAGARWACRWSSSWTTPTGWSSTGSSCDGTWPQPSAVTGPR